MNNHNCSACANTGTCQNSSVKSASVKASKKIEGNENPTYGYYSRVLNKPFDSVADLYAAEEAYYAEIRAKEEAEVAKAAAKTADTKKVDDAFKALNAARKAYKEDLTQLTKEYAESLDNLKKAYELGKKDIHGKLATTEEAYQAALKEYADKHPEGYRLVLKDGDFETTISGNGSVKKVDADIKGLFDMLFGW